MAQSKLRTKFVTLFSASIFLLFFVQMMAVGQPLLMSLMFASIMAGLTAGLGTISYAYKEYLQKRAFTGKKQTNQSTSNHQQRTVEIDASLDEAFDLALSALETLDQQAVPVADDVLVRLESLVPRKQVLKLYQTDKEQGIIRAGLRARTMGLPEFIDFSRIEIHLQAVDSQTTQITIDSKGNNIFDMYDLGKNLHYVTTLAQYLRRESQHLSAESRLSEQQAFIDDTELDDPLQDSQSQD